MSESSSNERAVPVSSMLRARELVAALVAELGTLRAAAVAGAGTTEGAGDADLIAAEQAVQQCAAHLEAFAKRAGSGTAPGVAADYIDPPYPNVAPAPGEGQKEYIDPPYPNRTSEG